MTKPTQAERFWAKVDRSGGPDACWPWTGFIDREGYGLIRLGDTSVTSSRLAWTLTNGVNPEGLEVDHECHNRDIACEGGVTCPHRRCCNPSHLDAVTHSVNMRRRGVDADVQGAAPGVVGARSVVTVIP